MVILTEQEVNLPEAKRLAQARVSKLGNLKLHLKALLAKKIRIELEIKHIQAIIKKKGKTSSKELRLSLNLESQEYFDSNPDRISRFEELSPELIEILMQGDIEAREIIQILREEELLTPEEDQELSIHL